MIAIRLPRVTFSADASCAIVAFSGLHRVSQQTHLAVRTHDDYRHAEAMLWGRLPRDEVLDAVAALADVYDAFIEEYTDAMLALFAEAS